MIDNTTSGRPEVTWSERFVGAALGGAVGDALGAVVRYATIDQMAVSPDAGDVAEYLRRYGAPHSGTDVSQITAFVLEGLIRARTLDRDAREIVEANLAAWLHTQGVPKSQAMRRFPGARFEPSGWLTNRAELYSHGNPLGNTVRDVAAFTLGHPTPVTWTRDPRQSLVLVACLSPTLLWAHDDTTTNALARDLASRVTTSRSVMAAGAFQATLLGRLVRGVPLVEALCGNDRTSRIEDLLEARPEFDEWSAWAAVDAVLTNGFGETTGSHPGEPHPGFDTASGLGEVASALAGVVSGQNFFDAVRWGMRTNGDSSVAGALAGQLAGARFGVGGIPPEWLDNLELREVVDTLAADAVKAFPPQVRPAAGNWAQRYVHPARPARPVGGTAAPELAGAQATSSDPEQTMTLPVLDADLAEPEPPFDASPEAGPAFPATEPEDSVVPSTEDTMRFAAYRDGPVEESAPAWPEHVLQPEAATDSEPADCDAAGLEAAHGERAAVGDSSSRELVAPEPEAVSENFSVKDDISNGSENAAQAGGRVPDENPAPDDTIASDDSLAADDAVADRSVTPDENPILGDHASPGTDAAADGVAEVDTPTPVDLPGRPTRGRADVPALAGLSVLPGRSESSAETPGTPDPDSSGSAVSPARAPVPMEAPEPEEPTPSAAAESAAAPGTAVSGDSADTGADTGAGAEPLFTERVLGCFLGGALGDALGANLEFRTPAQITAEWGGDEPRGLPMAYGVRGAITDDTQMTLHTAEGLIRGRMAAREYGDGDLLPHVHLAYQRWLHTQGIPWREAAGTFLDGTPEPDGWLAGVPDLFATRGPGKTVFAALHGFADGAPIGSFEEKINDSKGCGGVMRAAPAAMCSTDPTEVFAVAARTAALTHSHPAGYHSAGALAVIVQQALLGRSLDDGVWLALQVLETWEGHEETSALLETAVEFASHGVPAPDRLHDTLGGGWVGEQALAIAVCAALIGGDDVELALRVAAHHAGDSDSTAAICGNIVGALTGVAALPVDWLVDLELREVIEQLALDCVAEFGTGEFAPELDGAGQEDWHRYPARSLAPTAPTTGAAPEVFADDAVGEFPAPKPTPRRVHGLAQEDAPR
ncbi:ADP-ribosylglycohydrolase family protein [Allosaccharopolyspora coralli]|nr:ADP-ribosylglycohydrolase family protein [Allosaccharopolyspora coralli]